MSGNFLIEGTSQLIKGPMNRGNVLLLSAVPGVGKTIFGINFLEEGLKEEQPAIAMVTDFSPEDLVSMASTFNFNWEKHVESGLLKIVDCYSHMLGEEGTSPYFVENPENLTRVGRVLREAQDQDSGGRMLMDSASTLLLLSNDIAGVKFLSSMSARLKRSEFNSLFILEGGVHDSVIAQRLRYLLDGVLEMRVEEVGGELDRFFRIYSLRGCQHDTRWVHFRIGEKGIEVGE